MENPKKKKNKSIGKIFTNKRTVNVLIFIAFLALLYMVYSMIRSNSCDGDDCKNVNVTPAQFISFLLWVIAIIAIITIVIPTIVFLIYGKSQQKLPPSDRDDPMKFSGDSNNDEVDEDLEKESDENIPDFDFETANVTSSCPNRDSVEGFANRNRRGNNRYHVDSATGKVSTTRTTGGTIKKIEIPEYPNVNNDKWIHISKIPDMKNYVHKKELPCMANYVHKKEIPNMSEYIHKTKVPPVKTLKKTSELPDDLEIDKLSEIKKIFGIDMNNYILKTAIPQCLKCPDINDYVLKSSVPPF